MLLLLIVFCFSANNRTKTNITIATIAITERNLNRKLSTLTNSAISQFNPKMIKKMKANKKE